MLTEFPPSHSQGGTHEAENTVITTRILGIDPGSRVTGFGLIDVGQKKARYLSCGTIKTDTKTAIADRIKVIFEGVSELASSHQPDVMAIERVFMKNNPESALKLGQARGAAICAGVVRSIEVHEYSPTQVKQCIVGKGHAMKRQVQHMVAVLLKLKHTPGTDAADALAIALCHHHFSQGLACKLSRAQTLEAVR